MHEIYNPNLKSSYSFPGKQIPHFLRHSSSVKQCVLKMIIVTIAAILLSVLPMILKAYASQNELDLFDQGYDSYLSYQPQDAVESFQKFIDNYPSSSVKDAALFWLGKSLITLYAFDDAKRVFLQLKDEIPDSPFRVNVDNELKTMSSRNSERGAAAPLETVQADMKTLKNANAAAESKLAELTAERDHLRLLLEEEKMKTQELKARADRFEGEFRNIITRLQALQVDRESDHNKLAITQDHPGDFPPIPEKDLQLALQDTNNKNSAKEIVNGGEIPLGEKPEAAHSARKESPVARQISISSHTLELIADEETWVYATIDDKDVRERLLKPGKRIRWTAKNNFALKIGNAGGIKVIFDGKDIGPLGGKGKVVRIKLPSFNLSDTKKESVKVL